MLEDAAGDVWLAGTTYGFGAAYSNGWIAKLAADTGQTLLGGVRYFDNRSQEHLEDLLLYNGSLTAVGSTYASGHEQPTIGKLDLDGAWLVSAQFGGELSNPGEAERIYSAVPTSDGGLVLVGKTQSGQGSCTTCSGTDALIVKLAADLSTIEWTRAMGSPNGDEVVSHAVVLPDDAVIALGGGHGNYDYSGGAGTQIDSAPSYAFRVEADGMLSWARWLSFPMQRGGQIHDAVYDAAANEIVLVGHSAYTNTPVLAHMTPAGVITRVREVRLDDDPGSVTSVRLLPDGGLVIAGYELTPPNAFTGFAYVARLAPSREDVVWALRTPIAFTGREPKLLLSARGDLVLTVPGAGSTGYDALITRIGLDGGYADCWPVQPAQLSLVPATDGSTTPSFSFLPLAATLEILIPGTIALPAGAVSSCQ